METTVPEFLGSTSCFGTLLRQGQAAAGQGLCSQRGLGARQDASVAHRLGQGCTRQSSRHSDPCSRLCRPAVPSTETYSPEFKSTPPVPFGASFSCTDRTRFPKVFFLGGVTPCGMHDLRSPTRDRTPTLAPCSGSTES